MESKRKYSCDRPPKNSSSKLDLSNRKLDFFRARARALARARNLNKRLHKVMFKRKIACTGTRKDSGTGRGTKINSGKKKNSPQVYVDNRQSDMAIAIENIPAIANAVLQLEKQSCDEVGIHLVSIEEISQLHQQFFNDPSPTDCISCPVDSLSAEGPYRMLGDVFVCPKIAMQYAEEHNLDPYREVVLYIVHGLLHLMGFDDIEKKKRADMRLAEDRHMDNLKQLNLELHP